MASQVALKTHYNLQQGFTLLEVLVATIILFSSIATISLIYRGAFISGQKAEQHLKISSVVPSILTQIREDIRMQGNTEHTNLTGNGMVWEVQFSWAAKQIDFRSPQPVFSAEAGDFQRYKARYKLWLVDLTLTNKGFSKQFQFKELSWNDS